MDIRPLPALLTLFLAFPVLAVQPNIEPGQWEYTNVMRAEGVPMPEQRSTNRECITIEDVERGAAFVEDAEECEVSNLNLTRDRGSYNMVCTEEGVEMDMDVDMRFMGTTTEGTIRMDVETPMGPMRMHMELSGRRIGDC